MFSNGTFFAEIYPLAKKYDMVQALKTFVMEPGVPEELTVDGLKEKKYSRDWVYEFLLKEWHIIDKDQARETKPESRGRSDQGSPKAMVPKYDKEESL